MDGLSCITCRRWSGAGAEARQQPPAVHAVVAGALSGAVPRRVTVAAPHAEGQERAPGGISDDAGSATRER